MAKINLLPWRADRRKQRQKEFFVMLGAAGVAALLVAVGVVQFYSQLVANQNARNVFLQGEITKLDAAIKEIQALDKKKAELLARKAVIEQLQANRSQMVHLFDELVRTIPDGVRLNSIKQTGNQMTLNGVAQSNARVSAYMRSLEQSGYITKPELSVIEQKGNDKAMPYQFALRVDLTKPKKEGEEGLDETEDEDLAQAGGQP